MKPQTGILTPARTFLLKTVYTVPVQSECTTDSHTGVFELKVQTYSNIHTFLYSLSPLWAEAGLAPRVFCQ